MNQPRAGLQLRSLLKSSGELELSLAEVEIVEPGAGEVVVRVEGTPINPSDLGLLLGPADMTTAKVGGTPERPTLTPPCPNVSSRPCRRASTSRCP